MRVNVGCGKSPTRGWRNFDNSIGLRLAKFPLLTCLLSRIGFLTADQREFIEYARLHRIEYGDAVNGLPLPDASVEVLYSCHMIEHLNPVAAGLFLEEAKRVLLPGGIIRLVVPDLRKLALRYLECGDAEEFMAAACLSQPPLDTFVRRLKMLLVGPRLHQWMYDENSLCRLLRNHGFSEAAGILPGQTRIPDPGALDLCERLSGSVYVEGVNSGAEPQNSLNIDPGKKAGPA